MRLFASLYAKVMGWSRHRYAPRYLAVLSFAESSFFPIPPDVMLAPMSLATPARAWYYATLTTLTSVLGGLFGYVIGYFALELILPLLTDMGYLNRFELARSWFNQWGFWALFLAGFSPIPYKLFTIAAGALSMAIVPFIFASILGRGMRFFMVAGLMVWGGARMEQMLHVYIERIGWFMVGAAVIAYLAYRG